MSYVTTMWVMAVVLRSGMQTLSSQAVPCGSPVTLVVVVLRVDIFELVGVLAMGLTLRVGLNPAFRPRQASLRCGTSDVTFFSANRHCKK